MGDHSDPAEVQKILFDLSSILEDNGIFFEEQQGRAYFIGDIHGDCKLVERIRETFFQEEDTYIFFLGDYVDRSPKDCPQGSIDSFLGIAEMKIEKPDQVFILRGNHEAFPLLMFNPHEFPYELEDRFENYLELDKQFQKVFDELPLFARLPNGIFAVHGGVNRNITSLEDLKACDKHDKDTILNFTWADPVVTDTHRGDISDQTKFSYADFKDFMNAVDCRVMLRGHDHRTLGYTLYNDRLFTVFSSRKYESKGNRGVLAAYVDLDIRVTTVHDINILQLRGQDWVPYQISRFKPTQKSNRNPKNLKKLSTYGD